MLYFILSTLSEIGVGPWPFALVLEIVEFTEGGTIGSVNVRTEKMALPLTSTKFPSKEQPESVMSPTSFTLEEKEINLTLGFKIL